MHNQEEYKRISGLIAKKTVSGLDAGEERELELWAGSTPENRELYRRLTDPVYQAEMEKRLASVDVDRYWNGFVKKTEPSGRHVLFAMWRRYAAVAALVFTMGIGFWLVRHYGGPEGDAAVIVPGCKKACLMTENGRVLALDRNSTILAMPYEGALLSNDSCGLKYAGNRTGEQPAGDKASGRHTLVIPKGGEYIMTMEDGTRVYLNSDSRMEYPVHFSGEKREVFLEGEAYFKVKGDSCRPFVVHTRHMDVTVLGTEFNVKSYAHEKRVETTLVKGKVGFAAGIRRNRTGILSPSTQAAFDVEQEQLLIREVDVDPIVAWKNGQFIFKGERLEDIMTVLERWYDFDVFYGAEWIKDIEFAGKLNRSGMIAPILDVIRSTQKINVAIKGKTIVFSGN